MPCLNPMKINSILRTQQEDRDVKKALEVLQDKKMYNTILGF